MFRGSNLLVLFMWITRLSDESPLPWIVFEKQNNKRSGVLVRFIIIRTQRLMIGVREEKGERGSLSEN
ncbi:hypothetical protein VNO77_11739 [Canavalia gladiata]|uniref:Secreted protein n=1 Tax=Canavalia gladiata TaxID=3824 RepID=A0AAN9R2T7_CANGL